jgi:hypothetical protein
LVVAIAYLHDFARRQGGRQKAVVKPQQVFRHLLEHLQFVLVDIGPFILPKAVEKEPPLGQLVATMVRAPPRLP